LPAQGAYAFDLDGGIEHAALQLDLAESVARDHLAALAHAGFGGENFTVLVLARVSTNAAASAMFVEEVGGVADLVAHASADDIAEGPACSFADEVETGDLDRRERAGMPVQRIL